MPDLIDLLRGTHRSSHGHRQEYVPSILAYRSLGKVTAPAVLTCQSLGEAQTWLRLDINVKCLDPLPQFDMLWSHGNLSLGPFCDCHIVRLSIRLCVRHPGPSHLP